MLIFCYELTLNMQLKFNFFLLMKKLISLDVNECLYYMKLYLVLNDIEIFGILFLILKKHNKLYMYL